MTRYGVSGALNPDATTPDTGEPAGTHNGQPYWTWTTDEGVLLYYGLYYAAYGPIKGVYTYRYVIRGYTPIANPLLIDNPTSCWQGAVGSTSPVQDYGPAGSYTGTATVAEYVPPSSDPVLRGKLFLLISHVNGAELASPKKITIAEFDE